MVIDNTSTGNSNPTGLEALEQRILFSVGPAVPELPDWQAAALAEVQVGFDVDTSVYGDSGPLGDANPRGFSYLLHEQHGGSWYDAEKSPTNDDDDLMCWAGSAANVLKWTGWGDVTGLSTVDDIFAYYNDHWSDNGGLQEFGWEWWLNGVNDSQGWSGWSQVETEGGNFYPEENFTDYFHYSTDDAAMMSTLHNYMTQGIGTGIALRGAGAHAVTVWGVNYNPDNPTEYYGVWLTDSDDAKYTDTPPDQLRYYDVALSGGKWYLQNYYGSNGWYIGESYGLEVKPGGTIQPEVANADEYEGDDTWSYATAIATDGTTQAHSIHKIGDQDWVKFTLSERQKVTIELTGDSGDTMLSLYDDYTRNLLGSDDASGVGDMSLITRDGTACLEAGTYYLKITEDGNDRTIANYSVSVTAEAADGPMVKTLTSTDSVNFTDVDGDAVTLRLLGAGTGTLTFNNTGTVLESIAMAGTDSASSLYIVAGGGGTTLGSMTADAAMAGLYARTTDLVGSGIAMGGSTLGTVQLRDIADGAAITAGGSPADNTTFQAQSIGSANISFGSNLTTFMAYDYAGGTLTAGSIDSLSILGNAGRGITADFGANLSITGSDVGGESLHSGRILGQASGDWTLAGDAYTIQLGSASADFSYTSADDVEVFSCYGDMGGSMDVNALGRFNVSGDMSADLTTSGLNDQGYSAYLVQVGGAASGTWTIGDDAHMMRAGSTTSTWQLNASGYLMGVMTTGNMDGAISAESINLLKAGGDMAADVTITGSTAPGGLSLRAGMAGGTVSGSWNVAGTMQALVFSSAVNGWSLTGSDVSYMRMGAVADANVNLSGRASTVLTGSWSAGSMQAASMNRMYVSGDLGADITLTGVGVAPTNRALQLLSVSGTVSGSSIAIDGNVGVVSLGALQTSSIMIGCSGITGDAGDFGGNTYSLTIFQLNGGTMTDSQVAAWSLGYVNFDGAAGNSTGTIQYNTLRVLNNGGTFTGTTLDV